MFTGLVEGMGEVLAMRREGDECRFRFRPPFSARDLRDGESVAVNGACLSVERHDGDMFEAYASAETMGRTTLGLLKPGSRVNMERALALGGRLGGHLVSGHVDCVAIVRKMAPAGRSVCFRMEFPREYAEQVIAKGSVALDGVSLTVNERGQDFLTVNVIPDTRGRSTLGQWRPGCEVNMETDLIGKYVLGLMRPWAATARPGMALERSEAARGVSAGLLMKNGFM